MKCGNVKPAEYRRYQQLENFNWSCPVCLKVLQPPADSVSFRAETDVSEDDECPYEMLKNEISAGRGFLKTAHINVNGILTKSKLDEVRLLLRTTGLDNLGITESKLTNDVKDEDLDIAGYKFIRRDRPCEDGGGGCLLYYMEDMHLTENPRFLPHNIDNLEAIWIDILFHSQRLALSVMYRPPKDMSFYDTLDKQLQCIARRRKNIFIMGDLNSDVSMKGNNSDLGRKLLRILNRHGLSNVIKDFTRITDNTRSLIDLSISSNKSKIKKAGTFDTGIADHRLNYCVLHLFRKRSPAKLKTVVDWKHCDIKNFKDSLALVPWHTCNIFDDIDDNYWLAESLYKDLSKEFLKTRKAKIRDKSLPWMNSDIRKLMNKRYKLLVKAQASNNPDDWNSYRKLRNQVSKEMKIAEANYWSTKMQNKSSGSKEFWNLVKRMTGKAKTTKQIGPIMNEEKELVFDDLEKANTFNVFFSTIGEKLAKSFQSNKVCIDPAFHRITPSTGDLPSLSDKIFQVKFNTIDTQKSHGADNMSAKEMKIVGDEFSPCIANLSRLSYWSGSYPSQWKIGKVKVLWKSGNKEDCSNYRPITLLSIPSKITESVFFRKISGDIERVSLQSLFCFI